MAGHHLRRFDDEKRITCSVYIRIYELGGSGWPLFISETKQRYGEGVMEQTIAFAPAYELPQSSEGSAAMESSQAKRIVASPDGSELTVETISDAETFYSMEDSWNALVRAANLNHPFLTHQWIRSWWEAFGSGKTLHIVVVKAAGQPIGIAPLMLTRQKFYGVSLRSLEFISNVHTPRQDFIIASQTSEVIRAIWNGLLQQGNLWDVLMLRQLPADSQTVDSLSRLAEHGKFAWGLWQSADSPYLPIQGSWEDQFKRLDGKHRQNMRRRLKRLSEVGTVLMERVIGGTELESALDDGFRIEGAAWKDQSGTSIRACAETRLFYSRLAERFADRGWLDLNFLTVAGRRIAFNYCVRYENRIYLLKPGYDPELASYSPVNLLCYLSLQEAFASRVAEFDFLGVEDEWKREWTRAKRGHNWMFVFSKSPRAALVFLAKFRIRTALQKTAVYRSVSNKVGKLWRSRVVTRDNI